MTHILDLPDDVLLLVLSRVDCERTLARISEVSCVWRERAKKKKRDDGTPPPLTTTPDLHLPHDTARTHTSVHTRTHTLTTFLQVCTAWRTLAACPTAHPFLYAAARLDGRLASPHHDDGPGGGPSPSSSLSPAGPRARVDVAAASAWLATRAPAVRRLTLDDVLLSGEEWEVVLDAAAPGLTALEVAGDAARGLPWADLAALCPALASLAVRGCEGSLGESHLARLPAGLTLLRLEAARSPAGGGLARSGRPFLDGFPPAVLRLTGLRSLALASRGVGALPHDLAPIARLTHLSITHATLTALPPGFTALNSLAHLDLRGNLLLRGDAATAGQALAPLCALAAAGGGGGGPRHAGLTYLNLSSNGRRCDGGTALPAGLFGHTALVELHAADNPGLVVPADLARLASLRTLDLRSCGLKDYPAGLASLGDLRTLLLGRNARVARSGFASAGSLVDLERGAVGGGDRGAGGGGGGPGPTDAAVDAVTGRLAGLGRPAPPSGGVGAGGLPPTPPPTPPGPVSALRRAASGGGGSGHSAPASPLSSFPPSRASCPTPPPPFPPALAPTFAASLQVLDLSRSGLAAVPPTAAALTRLVELRLRGVTAYPGTGFDWASLAACGASLRRLDVSGCHLEALPVAALAALPHLTELVATDCGLTSFDVPAAAALPPGLAVLALDKNRLPYLPAAALAALPALEVVTLTDNLAMQLPPDLHLLAGLARLRTLDARKVSRGLCGARPWTARSMWSLARACAALEASKPARDWAGVLLL